MVHVDLLGYGTVVGYEYVYEYRTTYPNGTQYLYCTCTSRYCTTSGDGLLVPVLYLYCTSAYIPVYTVRRLQVVQ